MAAVAEVCVCVCVPGTGRARRNPQRSHQHAARGQWCQRQSEPPSTTVTTRRLVRVGRDAIDHRVRKSDFVRHVTACARRRRFASPDLPWSEPCEHVVLRRQREVVEQSPGQVAVHGEVVARQDLR